MASEEREPIWAGTPPFFRPEFEEAFRFIIRDYVVRERDVAIFLPCSVHKPYSTSPSHRLFDRVIADAISQERVHKVVFGTCGVVPRELERMYPYASYRYMLGRSPDPAVHRSFLRIETVRVAAYLEKTRTTYRHRVAYCLGEFREAMKEASARTGIPVTLVPSDETIARCRNPDARFADGSLSTQEYLDEFAAVLRGL
jgi:archaeosine synthase